MCLCERNRACRGRVASRIFQSPDRISSLERRDVPIGACVRTRPPSARFPAARRRSARRPCRVVGEGNSRSTSAATGSMERPRPWPWTDMTVCLRMVNSPRRRRAAGRYRVSAGRRCIGTTAGREMLERRRVGKLGTTGTRLG
uniref:Uncharacterized protein n=1 Tax=Hordeum vulgare subsp. vulgare TaxID=112509 RepID=A0A8I6YGT3_HORVV